MREQLSESLPERSREGRGDRDNRRGRGDRDNRRSGGRDRSSHRESEGHAGKEPLELTASAEPFILPGESLSRYRKGDDTAVNASEAASAKFQPALLTRPSTEIDIANWDGGMVLPGETLRGSRAGAPDAAQGAPRQASHAPETDAGHRSARAAAVVAIATLAVATA